MSLAEIKKSLFEANLNFDSNMPNEVFEFFTQHGIQVNKDEVFILSIAAGAIISQTKPVPNLANHGYTKYGITIEATMSHLNGYSKQKYLEIVSLLLRKSPQLTSKLLPKIKNIELSYRIFKKYRKSFQELWTHTTINKLVMNDMLSIFWVVYLLVKNGKQEIYEDLSKQVQLLLVLLKSIFQLWIANLQPNVVDPILQSNFAVNQDQCKEEFFKFYNAKFVELIEKLYVLRHQNQQIDFKRFSKNAILIARFLDDVSNEFYKETSCCEFQNYIDQISYLQLKKVLAPLPFKKPLESTMEPIKLTLKFSSEQRIEESPPEFKKQNENQSNSPQNFSNKSQYILAQNLSDMTPIRQRRDNLGITPCSNRIANLEWIRNCLDYINRPQTNELFRRVFNFAKKQSLADFQQKSRKQLMYLVEEFTPKCLKKEKRVNDIFLFFKYLVVKIYQGHKQWQNAQMFKDLKTFSSILCLSSDIFNYAHSSLVTSYREECQIFQVTLIEALKPLNWIGKNIQKPNELNNYLYSLQKRIVIKEIWEDETGYNLIRSQEEFNQSSAIGYNDMVIWKRLLRHIYDRIEQLSRQVQLDPKLTRRIQNLIQIILKNKPYLLQKNKIDQIIICCMTSFLTINQIHQKETLEKVFRDYNKMELSFNQNKDGLSGGGKQMTLSEFYNQVFLKQVHDIVNKNIHETDFLLTPIRNSLVRSGNITPFPEKYHQKQPQFTDMNRSFVSPFQKPGVPSIPILKAFKSPTGLNYRQKIVQQNEMISKSDIQENSENSQNMQGNSSHEQSQSIIQDQELSEQIQEQMSKSQNQNLQQSQSRNSRESQNQNLKSQ